MTPLVPFAERRIIIMKEITKEQIDEIITNASEQSAFNICNLLTANIQNYQSEFRNTELEQYAVDLSVLSTAIQLCTTIIKDSLIELLCD